MGHAYIGNRVGDSCLMSAVTLSHGRRQFMYARRGCALLAESCPSPVVVVVFFFFFFLTFRVKRRS